jgi:hypothetical protein
MKRKLFTRERLERAWVVTIDGGFVAGTAAYTRKAAIQFFMGNDKWTWEKYREAGYKVVRTTLAYLP